MDVFFMDVIWPAEFAAAGWALPLNRFFPPAEQEKFLEASILANTYQGQIYGIPVFIDAGMLYYRKDLLEKYGLSPPHTWPELVRQAVDLLVVDEIGKMECASERFRRAVEDALDAPLAVLATLGTAGGPFFQALRERPDVELIPVTEHNRDALVEEVCARLRATQS